MDVHLRLEADADGPIVVKSVAPGAVPRLRAEAARLARAVHPGVVGVVPPPDGTTPALCELRTRYAGEPVAGWSATLAGIAGVGAAVAVTLADLHATGFVHGRIDTSHVLIGDDGRPRLCGLSTPPPHASPADDVAALARVLAELAGRAQPTPGRSRSGRLAWLRRDSPDRRAFLQALDHATDPIPGRRPPARRFADELLAAVPDAELPRPRPRVPRRPPAAPPPAGSTVENRPRPPRTWLGDRMPGGPPHRSTGVAPTGSAARRLLAPWLAPLKPTATSTWPAEAVATIAGQPDPTRSPTPNLVPAGAAVVVRACGSGAPGDEPAAAPSSDDPTDQPQPNPTDNRDEPSESPPLLPPTAGLAGVQHLQVAPSPPAGHDPGGAAPGSPAPLAWTPADAEDDLLTRERPPPRTRRPADDDGRPARAGHRTQLIAAAGAVAALAAVMAVAGAALGRPGHRAAAPRPARPHPHAACRAPASAVPRADVDGDGCPEHVVVTGATVTAGAARWTVGQPGDRLAVGDWDCHGGATPAVLRPATGDIFVFSSWAAADAPVTVAPIAPDPGAVAIRRVDGGPGCDRLEVDLASGATTAVEVPR